MSMGKVLSELCLLISLQMKVQSLHVKGNKQDVGTVY